MNVPGKLEPHDDNEAARRTWNRRPIGSHRSAAQSGTPEYYRELRDFRYGYETPFLPDFFRYSGMGGKRVLEIGIGNGIDAVEIARSGAQYVGIDVTARHIELTRANFATKGMPEPSLVFGDLLEAQFPEPFDAVYSFGVLHHIPREREYLRRISELLRPGGSLLLGLYASFSSFNAFMWATWKLRAPRGVSYDDWASHISELTPLGDPVTIRIRSRREIQRMVEAEGFSVVRYAKRGFTQGHLPVFGKFCKPGGAVLTGLGSLFGWYHLFEFRKSK